MKLVTFVHDVFTVSIFTMASASQQEKPATPVAQGTRYEAIVPDTLSLAQRAELALNSLTGMLDPDRNWELWLNPGSLGHEASALPTNNPKYAESMPMMRVMSGSDFNLDIEKQMMQVMLSRIADDGFYYSPVKDRPWHGYKEDYANVYGQGRMLLAMMAWYQRDKDMAWNTRIQNMVNGLAKIAIYKDDYAYYPNPGFWESFSYPKSGWTTTEESADHVFGVHMYHCGQVRALARWYAMSGDETALSLARKLVNYLPDFSPRISVFQLKTDMREVLLKWLKPFQLAKDSVSGTN